MMSPAPRDMSSTPGPHSLTPVSGTMDDERLTEESASLLRKEHKQRCASRWRELIETDDAWKTALKLDVLEWFLLAQATFDKLPSPLSFFDDDMCPVFTRTGSCPRGVTCLWRHYVHRSQKDLRTQYIAVTLVHRQQRAVGLEYHRRVTTRRYVPALTKKACHMSAPQVSFPCTEDAFTQKPPRDSTHIQADTQDYAHRKKEQEAQRRQQAARDSSVPPYDYTQGTKPPEVVPDGMLVDMAGQLDGEIRRQQGIAIRQISIEAWRKLVVVEATKAGINAEDMETMIDKNCDICWDYNTKQGCKRASACRWRHDRLTIASRSVSYPSFRLAHPYRPGVNVVIHMRPVTQASDANDGNDANDACDEEKCESKV